MIEDNFYFKIVVPKEKNSLEKPIALTQCDLLNMLLAINPLTLQPLIFGSNKVTRHSL